MPPEISHAQLMAEVAVLGEKLNNVHKEMGELRHEIHGMKTDINRLSALANRWKGATFALLGIGGLVGWLAEKLFGFFK